MSDKLLAPQINRRGVALSVQSRKKGLHHKKVAIVSKPSKLVSKPRRRIYKIKTIKKVDLKQVKKIRVKFLIKKRRKSLLLLKKRKMRAKQRKNHSQRSYSVSKNNALLNKQARENTTLPVQGLTRPTDQHILQPVVPNHFNPILPLVNPPVLPLLADSVTEIHIPTDAVIEPQIFTDAVADGHVSADPITDSMNAGPVFVQQENMAVMNTYESVLQVEPQMWETELDYELTPDPAFINVLSASPETTENHTELSRVESDESVGTILSVDTISLLSDLVTPVEE